MNPFLSGLLMGFVRWALQGVFVWMLQREIMKDGQQEEVVAWVAGSLATLGWIIWVKIRERKKQLTAAASPAGTTEAAIEAKVKAGMAPPVTLAKDVKPHLEPPKTT